MRVQTVLRLCLCVVFDRCYSHVCHNANTDTQQKRTQVVTTDGNRVVELNDKFVELLSRESHEYSRSFLVLFYAPWCHHCHLLEPIWIQVAQHIHNYDKDIYVARLDCTKHTAVSTHFSIRGFPTILFITKDKRIEFRGERSRKEIIDFALRVNGPPFWSNAGPELHNFALRVNGPPVRPITDCSQIDPLRQTHDVFFASFGQTPDQNFTRMAANYQSIDWFYHSSHTCHPFGDGIYVMKSNNFHKRFDESESDLEEWIKIERFGQFVRITNGNFHLLLQTGQSYQILHFLHFPLISISINNNN
ncbi:unnamed protein product [Oppiella nova]|uniref:Thioredoxin domain-containing protein n=1 Tax=Oppiella nova TaxID=334625 RepID=A0A7R9MDX8_9ACAR|nr:unnamed protein product [Oppiella nova]CAG2175574.1 unnamed protein product [Oppiella nova]